MFKPGDLVRVKPQGKTRSGYNPDQYGEEAEFMGFDTSGNWSRGTVSKIMFKNKNIYPKGRPYIIYTCDIETCVIEGDDDEDCI